MKLTTLAESYLARLASLSSRLVVGPPRPIVMAQKAGKCKNYDEGSASAHAFMPASLDEQSPKAARIASSQSATIRSRSIPGGGRMGVNGSPAHVSNSGGGLVATAITFGPQPASNSVERVIAAISVGLRTFVRSINFAFRLPRRFRRNQVRALVGFLHDPACGFHLPHKIAPFVPVSIDRCETPRQKGAESDQERNDKPGGGFGQPAKGAADQSASARHKAK